MDNLTHGLVGAALARAGLDRRTPLAAATLVIAANVPDVDVLSYVRGPYFALSFRRGITHGVPALLLLPFAVAGVVLAWDRWIRRRRDPDAPPARFGPLLLLAAIGVLTHPVLDWMNTYGMRWWLPFDGRWSYGDSLFIIDPWLWLLLGAAAALGGARSRAAAAGWLTLAALTSAPVLASGFVPRAAQIVWVVGIVAVIIAWFAGRANDPSGRPRVAAALGVVALLYIGAMVVTHRGAASDVRAELAASPEGEPQEVMIAPLPALPLRSELIVAASSAYLRGTVDWTESPAVAVSLENAIPRAAADPSIPPGAVADAIAAARLDPDVMRFLVWSRYPFWTVRRAASGYEVTVGDARYTERGGALSGLTVTVLRTR